MAAANCKVLSAYQFSCLAIIFIRPFHSLILFKKKIVLQLQFAASVCLYWASDLLSQQAGTESHSDLFYSWWLSSNSSLMNANHSSLSNIVLCYNHHILFESIITLMALFVFIQYLSGFSYIRLYLYTFVFHHYSHSCGSYTYALCLCVLFLMYRKAVISVNVSECISILCYAV